MNQAPPESTAYSGRPRCDVVFDLVRVFACGLLIALSWGCGREPGGGADGATSAGGAPRDGAEIYRACQLCHTPQEMQRGPVLNGLPAWYVEEQLQKFRSGIRGQNLTNRGEALMGAATPQLRGAEEIKRVAAYIEAMPVRPHLRTVRGNVERGREVFQNCFPCHGERGQGNPLIKSPPLTMQEDWYLLDQARKIASGLRGYHRLDIESQTMLVVIKHLKDEDFRDVIAYMAEAFAPTNSPANGGL